MIHTAFFIFSLITCNLLVNDHDKQGIYQAALKNKFDNRNTKWENIILAITKTAEEVLRYNTKHEKNRDYDEQIKKMSKE